MSKNPSKARKILYAVASTLEKEDEETKKKEEKTGETKEAEADVKEESSTEVSEKAAEESTVNTEETARKPEESKQEEPMAVPPSKTGKTRIDAKSHKRHRRLFSPALFKESFKSNRVSLAVVSAGNALIMVIIIGILSTLHINATADAMKDLFSNADQESTVKLGSVSMYSSFYNTAYAYENYKSSKELLSKTITTSIDMPNNDQVKNLANQINTSYTTSLAVARKAAEDSGTTFDEKTYAQTWKVTGTALIKQSINNLSDDVVEQYLNGAASGSQAKSLCCFLVDRYAEQYITDTTQTYDAVLKIAVPKAFTDEVAKEQKFDGSKNADGVPTTEEKKKWDAAYKVFTDAQTNATAAGWNEEQAAIDGAFKLIKLVADGETRDFAVNTTNALQITYEGEDTDTDEVKASKRASYIADPSIQANELASACESYVMTEVENFSYYNYLPTFTVEFLTSDRGYPIAYKGTGRYGSNGEEILEQVEVTTYNPDVYEYVKGDMGTKANMLQKMHKDVITGTGYTDEEIAEAKEKAKDDTELLRTNLHSFMEDYIYRENGTNKYYNNGIQEDAIRDRAVNIISAEAEKTIIQSYNDSHLAKVDSIDQINARNSAMDAKEMMSLVQGYATSGIASYKTYNTNAMNAGKGYSTMDCMMIATVKSGQGVIDQLPAGVASALEEMGQMNTYGIMVGVVAFGIATLLIPMVYTILTSNSLVAEKVETGSLAFTLSTPTPRSCFVFTEGVYLMFTEVVMALSLYVATIITREIGIACGSTDLTSSLPIGDISLYALGNFTVTVAVSGICFLSSCWFNKTNKAIGVGGGLTIFFFICSILGLFGTSAIPATVRISAMNFFNYITLDSCFDAMAVMNKNWSVYTWKLLIAVVIAVITYIIGDIRFVKKDLPL